MRRRYGDCQRADGNCAACPLVSNGKDCHGKPIAKLAWARMAARMDQPTLAERSGVNIRQIQRTEAGEADAGNMTARNLLAIADVLGVDPRELFD